jgi:methyl-accepting chemotaxis protein
VEESAAAAASLKEQADRLAQAVAVFKLSRHEAQQVIVNAQASARTTGVGPVVADRPQSSAPPKTVNMAHRWPVAKPAVATQRVTDKPVAKPSAPSEDTKRDDDWKEF